MVGASKLEVHLHCQVRNEPTYFSVLNFQWKAFHFFDLGADRSDPEMTIAYVLDGRIQPRVLGR